MNRTTRLRLFAASALVIAAIAAFALPASAYHVSYQRYCAQTSVGLVCWYQPVRSTAYGTTGGTSGGTTSGSAAAPAQPAPAQPASGLTAQEQQMLSLINRERQKAGLSPLQADPQLTKVARLKSQDMIQNRYFSHQSPTYGSPFDMLRRFGISYRTAGENIAGNRSVEAAHAALMNSPGHRANILNRSFTQIGIGIQTGGQYGSMFTQLFKG